jgi:hypothetical protein
MAETTYSGSCHCGRVKYEVTTDLAKGPVIACNCSMCGRKGTLLTFVGAGQFKLLEGEDALTDYQFNKHVIHHLFCSTCGITSFCRGTNREGRPMVAINVRCLEGVEPSALPVTHFDGRSH